MSGGISFPMLGKHRREIADGKALARCDVVRQVVGRIGRRSGRDVGAHDVGDMDEVARLRAILENDWRLVVKKPIAQMAATPV